MADPSLASNGATVFPATGVLGPTTPTVDPATLVGQEVATFDLGLSATGTVVAADSAPVSGIANDRVAGRGQAGPRARPGLGRRRRSAMPWSSARRSAFPVHATAKQIANLDPATLEKMVLGKPIPEAKAILAPFGDVEITVSPDWTGSVPSFDSRVDVTVDAARPDRVAIAVTVELDDPVTRLLGVDLGERRVGLALADDADMPAAAGDAQARSRPRRRRGGAADRGRSPRRRRAGRRAAARGVGRRGTAGALTRAWAEAIHARLRVAVTFHDERLSSHLAETRLGPMKRGRSGGPPSKTQRDAYRARVDREAAAIILQDELDTRAGRRSSMPRPPDPQETSR